MEFTVKKYDGGWLIEWNDTYGRRGAIVSSQAEAVDWIRRVLEREYGADEPHTPEQER